MAPSLSRLSLVGLLLVACTWDAPRDNPLDPTLGGNVDGRVLTRRATGIGGALVTVPAASRFCHSDSAGRFAFRGLPDDTVVIRVSADGYAPDSVGLELERGRVDTLTRYLNGLPSFSLCRATSHVYGRNWPPVPLTFFRLVARASDLDGDADIDSVWTSIPAVEYSARLPYDPEQRRFGLVVWADSLPDASPETLVGQRIDFLVADLEGAVRVDTSCRVVRILADLPAPAFPSGGLDTLDSDTVFHWHRFDPGYGIGYLGQVVRIESGGPAGVVLEFSTGDTSWPCPAAGLPTGDYYWTIEAVDKWGNSSRSAEERFHVR